METQHYVTETIKPHTYHWTITITALIFLISLLYFIFQFFPTYYHLRLVFKTAEYNFTLGNYTEAIKGYTLILKNFNSFKMAKIKKVQGYFPLGKKQKALKLLSNMELTHNDLELLKKYIPFDCQHHFQPKTNIIGYKVIC